jgi:hypothetical protein
MDKGDNVVKGEIDRADALTFSRLGPSGLSSKTSSSSKEKGSGAIYG